MSNIEKYIERYGLESDAVVFRAGAPFTAHFGLDNTFDELRLHMGVDRGRGQIFAPFDGVLSFAPDKPERFGNLLTLDVVEYGFEVRIAHMSGLSEIARAFNGTMIKAGMYLGDAGKEGRSTGPHTHTEIVSIGARSPTLDELMTRQGYKIGIPYTTEEVVSYCAGVGIHKGGLSEPLKAYKAQYDARQITFINKYVCDRIDYLTGERRRFYSSYYAFKM